MRIFRLRVKTNSFMTSSTITSEQPAAGAIPLIDIDAYFSRIHYEGSREPTLETLQAIHLLHPQHIPFENLNPLLGIPVKLDIDSLVSKIILKKRGGYCFEQNLLLKTVLESLGFKVKGLAARVLWNAPIDAITARGHMLLLNEIDSVQYVADVGFGGQTLTGPLVLKAGITQATPHEPYRLVPVGDEFRLEVLIRDEWRALYRFGLQEQFPVDYEVSSWYLSSHPESHFVTGLVAARVENDKRYTLRNNEFAVHHPGGNTERRRITNAGELEKILIENFRVDLPAPSDLKAVLRRIADKPAQG
jgi:N-hydroxyarylamine O-acetyltransferase